ncbi:hypothetical protein E5676_scaffold237G001520 [Cucumis melo var. makuwa]|uniref:Uncharacterized protein n=1 Tax=Cucumis melo var. makuwa TaxID=1194695 RepID=A0A5A7T3W7_CUCMM|nr:hypothetical protein E6C27_scaffold36G002400 [Cucumis melo var. makuwa]TYK20562.1 hypothetical protein E5676_scaffold237G001520 [Cucumis melo var. makuwa]
MIRSKFEKDYPTLHFKNDKDTVKILVFYFIKLVMIGQKKRKVALHKKKHANNKSSESYSLHEFSFAFQADETVSSISEQVAHRESHLVRQLTPNHVMAVVKPVDEERGTFVNENPEDGIISIDVPSGGEYVPLPPPEPMLESKDEANCFKLCILYPC